MHLKTESKELTSGPGREDTKQVCSATSTNILLHLLPTFVVDIQNFNLKRPHKLLPNSIDV